MFALRNVLTIPRSIQNIFRKSNERVGKAEQIAGKKEIDTTKKKHRWERKVGHRDYHSL